MRSRATVIALTALTFACANFEPRETPIASGCTGCVSTDAAGAPVGAPADADDEEEDSAELGDG